MDCVHPMYPKGGSQTCWDEVDGMDGAYMAEYMEVAHMMNCEEEFGVLPLI